MGLEWQRGGFGIFGVWVLEGIKSRWGSRTNKANENFYLFIFELLKKNEANGNLLEVWEVRKSDLS